MNNTSVCKYWKILLYHPNTDTGTFYGGSTDIDTDAQYPKSDTDILVFSVFYIPQLYCKFVVADGKVIFLRIQYDIFRSPFVVSAECTSAPADSVSFKNLAAAVFGTRIRKCLTF